MTLFVQIIYVLITVVLILVVLLQAGRGGGLGTALGGGASTAGAALVGSGSLLSAAGILLLAIPGPRNKDLRPVPSDSSGPWALIP